MAAEAAAAKQPAAKKKNTQKSTETRRLVCWDDGEYYAVKEIAGRKFLQKSKVWKYEVKCKDGGQRNLMSITDFHDPDLWQEYDRANPRGNIPMGEKQVCLPSYSNSIVSYIDNNIHPSLIDQWSQEYQNKKTGVRV